MTANAELTSPDTENKNRPASDLVGGIMGRRSWVALLVSISLLVLGLPAPPVAAITQPNQITYVHDELGRLEAAIDPAATNGIARYNYDARGNLLSRVFPRGAEALAAVVGWQQHAPILGRTSWLFGRGPWKGESGLVAGVLNRSPFRIGWGWNEKIAREAFRIGTPKWKPPWDHFDILWGR